NPLFIIIFAAVFATLWTKLGDRQPSTPLKFALANLIMGVAYLVFLLFVGSTATPLLGIVGILFLFTMAELLLSPVGQSLATKLAPEAFKTQMVALFFLTVSIGSALSGVLAAFYDPADASAERAYFLVLGVASIAVAVVMALLAPWIRKRLVGVRWPGPARRAAVAVPRLPLVPRHRPVPVLPLFELRAARSADLHHVAGGGLVEVPLGVARRAVEAAV